MIRTLMAIFMAVVAVAAVWFLPEAGFKFLVLIIVAAGALEYAAIFFADVFERAYVALGAIFLSSGMLFCPMPKDAALMAIVSVIFLVPLFVMWRQDSLEGSADKVGVAVFGILYLGSTLPFWSWLRELPNGAAFVLMAIAAASCCDIFALIAGKSIGKRKFAPLVSPNKTIEGFVAALLGSFVGALVVRQILLPDFDLIYVAMLSATIWLTAPFGDLIESLLKRSRGIKDSGHIIPGHGGALDRLDALIFTGPAAYAIIKWMVNP